ncbi:uncharacterized protein LOC127810083 isoform X2 [Diospyros lotus]|uniref:uncharacterized protein LOC127810083 isoform X2 n=1 Tax=Diospyros lotus TaxID=55363 RepID=UPI0022567D10|nr:uncharacterized protein LOC127810083 isoform X2 [Diospyros lotus]
MERSEPTLIPEWLKGSASVSGGTLAHQMASSSSYSDDRLASKPSRNKSSVIVNDHDTGRSFFSDRATSSYFRQGSNSNGSHHRSHGSFGRNNRGREWDKETYDFPDKEKSADRRRLEYSDTLDNILPSRFEKDLRRTQSMITGKRNDAWPRKTLSDASGEDNKNNPNNSNGVLGWGKPVSNVRKSAFERDFPSLGNEESPTAPEIGRVTSPVLTAAIQNLPTGTSAVIGGDGWTSALAEVPVLVGSNCTAGTVQKAIPFTAASSVSSVMTGLNMAEALAQGPSRAQPPIPQLSAGNQRLEELAIKQSRQLIPVTPSAPKASVLSTSDKPKLKIGQQLHQTSSSPLANHSPRGGLVKSDISRSSTVGKLHVLKPARERNGASPTAKDSLSPTSGSRVASSPVAFVPSVAGSTPSRSPSHNPNAAPTERKTGLVVLEKRPISQGQSRNDFFNLMRQKSLTSPSSVGPGPDPGSAASSSPLDKSNQTETCSVGMSQGGDSSLLESPVRVQSAEKTANDINSNGNALDKAEESLTCRFQETLNSGQDHSSSNAILYSEEEEAAFLRSLGWEENAGEDEGLTEEEITSFYKEYSKLKPSSRIVQGIEPRFLVPLNLRSGIVGAVASSGSSPSDSKFES